MKRKLVKQGAATMMISLPSKWIKENKLEKGDEVDLEEKNNAITIHLDKQLIKKEIKKLNLSDYKPLLNRVVLNQYIQGVDELELSFNDFLDFKKVQKEIMTELLGFEVIKQTGTNVIIRDVTGYSNQNLDDFIKRVLFILDSISEELVNALENKSSLEPVIESDESVNKFASLCLRIMNKEPEKKENLYLVVSSLEEIGDLYKEIAKECSITKVTKEQITILKDLRAQLKIFSANLFDYKKEKLIESSLNHDKIKKKISLKNKIDYYLFELDQKIVKLNTPILFFNS